MIGQIISNDKGEPLDNSGNKLSQSAYQPADEVKKLFSKIQRDYQIAYALQHRSFQEFDGFSLLQRARMDQETFGAFVGAEYVPVHKRWRWKGRKNTSRNKIIGILAHMIAGMLYPFVYAKNEKNEEDKMTARVMRILVEDHLKKAGYETKFLFMVLSALVNPAVIVEVEYIEAMQVIKQRLEDGTIEILEAVDEVLSGLNLNIIPVDEFLVSDFFTGTISRQAYVMRVRRISWDTARKIHAGKHQMKDGKDPFDFVQAGKTRVMLTGQENQTLFDVEWTEADRDYVQELTVWYKDEDLEVTWVGGVFMGSEDDVFNTNPFKHRRMTLSKGEWLSIPIVPFAKTGFEPIDPTGRFFYYKSAAFKEYWDDQALNAMQKMVFDGTALDVIKPLFMSGVAKVDSTVLAPGATIGMPSGATVTPFSMGSNLMAAYNAINQQEKDISESTQDRIMGGNVEKGVTAYATSKAENNARIILGVFGAMIADLIRQIGELTMDCVIQYTTVGDLDSTVPEALKMKFNTFLVKGKDKGKTVTNRIVFSDEYMGKKMTKAQVDNEEWKIYNEAGGDKSDQRIYKVNPYQFARYTYTLTVDPDKIVMKSTGTDRQEKLLSFNILTDPRVAPFTDQKAVVDDFAIEEYGGDDPDRYKSKQENPNEMLNSMMGNGAKPLEKPTVTASSANAPMM